MAFEHERRAARRILDGIELGTLSTADAWILLGEADPAYVHLLFSWLRAKYAGDHSAAGGVIGRIVEICTAHPEITRRARSGASAPIVEWFEETYDYRDLDADEFVALVVEKLEG